MYAHACVCLLPFSEEQVPSRTLVFKASGPLVSSQYLPHLGQLQLRLSFSFLFFSMFIIYDIIITKLLTFNTRKNVDLCIKFIVTIFAQLILPPRT
jgi:hypothetical protein